MTVLLAALWAVSGCAPHQGTTGMETTEPSGPAQAEATKAEASLPYDAQFLDALIRYSQHTRDLAELGARRAQHPELKVAAENVARAQDARIAELESWRSLWYGKSRPGMESLEQASELLQISPYAFGSAWQIPAAELAPAHPEAVQGVQSPTSVDAWGAKDLLAALKALPDAAFEPYYTAALVEHERWGMEAAGTAAPKLEHPELRAVAQEVFMDNLIHLHEIAGWRNEWFGAQTEGLGPPEEEPGTH